MIGFLSGIIHDTYPIIISLSGVGYIVHAPEYIQKKFAKGDTCELYIHTHVREDAFDLYGFLTKEELHIFEMLLTVSGIGPRTGLNVMNHGVNEIEKAVRESDVDFFTTIPRLGRKNAQKIIIELKNKLGSLQDLNLHESEGDTKEVVDALLSMGFVRNEIMTAMKKLTSNEVTIEQKIRKLLQFLGSRRS